MLRYFSKSILLLSFLVVIVCGIYPLILWGIGQYFFPFQANGSILVDFFGNPVGSKLIAQPFSRDEYFQPRPSAAFYDASASSSSALAASNYALRNRVANTLGPIVKYQDGRPVSPDIEKWFHQDTFQGKPHIVAQWAVLHPLWAQPWINKEGTEVKPGSNIQALFFDMWRQDHPDVMLQNVPGDRVTTSASGLDPHITLQNAESQLDRVASKWATYLKRNPADVKNEIEIILQNKAHSPLQGLVGEKLINVLEVNFLLHKIYD